jgi:hypothetical protein
MTLPPLTFACPCGTEIQVPIEADLVWDDWAGVQRLAFDPDYSDLWAHAWTHDETVNFDFGQPDTP